MIICDCFGGILQDADIKKNIYVFDYVPTAREVFKLAQYGLTTFSLFQDIKTVWTSSTPHPKKPPADSKARLHRPDRRCVCVCLQANYTGIPNICFCFVFLPCLFSVCFCHIFLPSCKYSEGCCFSFTLPHIVIDHIDIVN